MDFKELQDNWHALGEIDPFWAILSDPDKVGNKWDVAEFFSTGREEISEVMASLASLGVEVRRRRALDFGCGAGRLTQALAEYFDTCDGVDVAPSMLDLARKFNRHPERCRYHLNQQPALELFDRNTFDFIYCNIVLQHMKPEYSLAYVREFLRVLDVDGLAMFQIPSQLLTTGDSQQEAQAPLPELAYRAKLRLLNTPARLAAGSRYWLKVRVRNVSEHVWTAGGSVNDSPVRVGTRWRAETDGAIVAEDGRADLNRPLEPGELADVEIVITAPRMPGSYRLEVDLVQELVAWFRDRGSFAVQSTVEVEGSPTGAGESQVLVPSIQMHCVPREAVENLVRSEGGEMVDVREDDWAGAGWRSLRYCVRKPR
jgi:ubiquinone/menaquinone biosynthesis C-methylase UbiE